MMRAEYKQHTVNYQMPINLHKTRTKSCQGCELIGSIRFAHKIVFPDVANLLKRYMTILHSDFGAELLVQASLVIHDPPRT